MVFILFIFLAHQFTKELNTKYLVIICDFRKTLKLTILCKLFFTNFHSLWEFINSILNSLLQPTKKLKLDHEFEVFFSFSYLCTSWDGSSPSCMPDRKNCKNSECSEGGLALHRFSSNFSAFLFLLYLLRDSLHKKSFFDPWKCRKFFFSLEEDSDLNQ